jgi:2-C-methyl-D-erythritol 4-phosphate cytidylyltransferase
MNVRPRYWAVVPAAGKGSRMRSNIPKQYLPLGAHTVLECTLERLLANEAIAGIVVAVSPGDETWAEISQRFDDRVFSTNGGAERVHSVLAGLEALASRADPDDWVLVHDAARPCLRAADLQKLIDELTPTTWGGILAMPVRDTLKRCAADGAIETTVDRSALWHALTPQMFRLGQLAQALQSSLEAGRIVTDEAQAIEFVGGTPRVVEGHSDNIKITRPDDLPMAGLILAAQERA